MTTASKRNNATSTKTNSVSETGHNKNVANFNSVYQVLQEMGTLYNPTNPKIQLQNLDPLRTSLQNVMTELNNKKPVYKNAVAAREIAIEPLSKLITRALNYAKSLDISTTDKENIASQAKKIRGDQKLKKINPETLEADGISTSQQSYDSRIANLNTFSAQLASHTQYAPNETDIQVATFQSYHANLVTLSAAVNTAGNALITARKNRNEILYKSDVNIINLVKDIKAYLKSLGDTAKPYYNVVVKLKFTTA